MQDDSSHFSRTEDDDTENENEGVDLVFRGSLGVLEPENLRKTPLPINKENIRFVLSPSLQEYPEAKSPSSPNRTPGDRFIPMRNELSSSRFVRISDQIQPDLELENEEHDFNQGVVYDCLLKNELLKGRICKLTAESENTPSKETGNIFQFSRGTPRERREGIPSNIEYRSPLGICSQELLISSRKKRMRIPRLPHRVLDAPDLKDDFYLNLVDWSSRDVLGVGLGSCVYLLSEPAGKVTRLLDLGRESDSVASVGWSESGDVLAVGTGTGGVQVWDWKAGKEVARWAARGARVGALAWSGDLLSAGCRDGSVVQRDLREGGSEVGRRLSGHGQEVCGLAWSPDRRLLASGGNDNLVNLWSPSHSSRPLLTIAEHTAAVKAIAWSPHHHSLLATGGGTADKTLRFWNTLTSRPAGSFDTGSQVCNLAWSRNSIEIVSTHGFSDNQIVVWKYPSMKRVAELTGHSYRVLYLAMSPDGRTIVTGAGDETLRFWTIFPDRPPMKKENRSGLRLLSVVR